MIVPVATVAGVSLSWFAPSAALQGARVYGSHLGASLSLRVISSESTRGVVSPLRGEFELRLSEPSAEASIRDDSASGVQFLASRRALGNADGVVSFSVDLPEQARGAVQIEVLRLGQQADELARAVLEPERPDARAVAGESLGTAWAPGRSSGQFEIRAGLGQGVLAVPFPADLIVEVREAGVPQAGVSVSHSGVVGAQLRPDAVLTDSSGRASFVILPIAHVVELSLDAGGPTKPTSANGERTSQVRQGTWFGQLPVVAGALWSRVQSGQLLVSSPVPHRWAYVDWITPRGQTWNTSVALSRQGQVWQGAVSLPPNATLPAHAVTSSEPDLQSMALVGWAIGGDAPGARFERRSPLLIDGLAEARFRLRAQHAALRRRGGGLALVGAMLEAALLYLLYRKLRPRRFGQSTVHGPELGDRAYSTSQPNAAEYARGVTGVAWWAGLCIVAALVALGVFSWLS